MRNHVFVAALLGGEGVRSGRDSVNLLNTLCSVCLELAGKKRRLVIPLIIPRGKESHASLYQAAFQSQLIDNKPISLPKKKKTLCVPNFTFWLSKSRGKKKMSSSLMRHDYLMTIWHVALIICWDLINYMQILFLVKETTVGALFNHNYHHILTSCYFWMQKTRTKNTHAAKIPQQSSFIVYFSGILSFLEAVFEPGVHMKRVILLI